MQPDLTLKPKANGKAGLRLHFKDSAEEERFDAVFPSVELTEFALQNGYEAALEHLVPCLLGGGYGADEATIDRNIEKVVEAGRLPCRDPATREHEEALSLCRCIGTRSALMAAKEHLLTQLAVLEKGTEALKLITAGLNAATEATALAAGHRPAVAAPGQRAGHLLSLSQKRPLRPEDFGALPTGGR